MYEDQEAWCRVGAKPSLAMPADCPTWVRAVLAAGMHSSRCKGDCKQRTGLAAQLTGNCQGGMLPNAGNVGYHMCVA
jgi:hypothetical protein